jgi:hypothetical protein
MLLCVQTLLLRFGFVQVVDSGFLTGRDTYPLELTDRVSAATISAKLFGLLAGDMESFSLSYCSKSGPASLRSSISGNSG